MGKPAEGGIKGSHSEQATTPRGTMRTRNPTQQVDRKSPNGSQPGERTTARSHLQGEIHYLPRLDSPQDTAKGMRAQNPEDGGGSRVGSRTQERCQESGGTPLKETDTYFFC